jgi:hypothetical protein
MNTRGSNSFLNYYSTVNRYMGCISTASLGFIPNKPGPNLVVFVLSVSGISAAS